MNRGKRVWIALIAALLTLLLSLTAAMAGEPDKEGCPGSSDGAYPAGEHEWVPVEYDNIKSPLVVWECKKCKHRKYVPMEEGEHVFLRGWTQTKAATCEAAGEEARTCDDCGRVETRSIAALGHSWDGGKVTTPATCAAEGTKTFTCTRCRATKTEKVAKTAHTPATVAGKAATCTESGLTEGTKCSVCGEVLKAQETIPATGHDWKTETIKPDGLTDGKTVKTCRSCGKSETTVIPASEGFFDRLRGVSAGADGSKELKIVGEPTVTENEDGTCTWSVEAEGGVGPYRYEWFRVINSEDAAGSKVLPKLAKSLENAENDLTTRFRGIAESVGKAYEKTGVVAGVKNASETSTILPELLTTIRDQSGQSIQSWGDAEFACRVTDIRQAASVTKPSKGRIALLKIISEPEDLCLDSGNGSVSVKVMGGTKPYQYQWYRVTDGNTSIPIEGATKKTYVASGKDTAGDIIYCVIKDAAGFSVTSRMVTVFATPLNVYPTGDIYNINGFNPTQDIRWELFFGGASAGNATQQGPFTYTCYYLNKRASDFDLNEGWSIVAYLEDETHYDRVYWSEGPTEATSVVVTAKDPGYYLMVVTTPRGNKGKWYTYVGWGEETIRITEQPKSGELGNDGTYLLEITADISACPKSRLNDICVHLYCDGQLLQWRTDDWPADSDMVWEKLSDKRFRCSVPVLKPGEYFFYVLNMYEGHWAVTDTVSVTKAAPVVSTVPVINVQPQDVTLVAYAGEIANAVLYCDAFSESGDELRFEWVRKNAGSWMVVGTGKRLFLPITAPVQADGPYYCRVTNTRTGETVQSQGATVTVRFTNVASHTRTLSAENESALRQFDKMKELYESLPKEQQEKLSSRYEAGTDELETEIAKRSRTIAGLADEE
jgi:hypothetical protein